MSTIGLQCSYCLYTHSSMQNTKLSKHLFNQCEHAAARHLETWWPIAMSQQRKIKHCAIIIPTNTSAHLTLNKQEKKRKCIEIIYQLNRLLVLTKIMQNDRKILIRYDSISKLLRASQSLYQHAYASRRLYTLTLCKR